MKRLALCGITAALLDMVIPLAVGSIQNDYSHLHQYVSEMGAPGQPYGHIVSAWFILYGILLIAFSLGIPGGFPGNRAAKIAGFFLMISGLLNGVGAGLFPCDPGCLGKTFSGQMHNTLAAIGATALAVTPFFLWLAMGKDSRWQKYRRFTMVIQVVGLVVFVLFVLADNARPAGSPQLWVGALQRLFYAVYYLWLIVIAVKFFRMYDRIR